MKTILTGQPERVYWEYRDANNVLTDPVLPKANIFAPDGTRITASSADGTKEDTGIYYYTVSLSSAATTQRGLYQLWPEGYIGGALITVDEPIYFEVADRPTISSQYTYGRTFYRKIRHAIGDIYEDEYIIAPQDLAYYIRDGVVDANSVYNFGYDAKVSTAGNNKAGKVDFYYGTTSTSLPSAAETWYAVNIIKLIMESQIRLNMFGPGIINAGDIKMSLGLRDQIAYLKELKEDQKNLLSDLTMNGDSGFLINTYKIKDLSVSEE